MGILRDGSRICPDVRVTGLGLESKNVQLRTSETDPIRVDFLPESIHGLVGAIGITLAPGKRDVSNGWLRDLETDVARLRAHYQADCLVSLMEPSEFATLGISELGECALANGIQLIVFPIADMHPPYDRDRNAFIELVKGIIGAAGAGQCVVIHCRAGVGRSGLVGASVLVARGIPAAEAINVVRTVRSSKAVETAEQRAWVESFEGVFGPDTVHCVGI